MTGVLPAWKLGQYIQQQKLPGRLFLLFGPDASTVDTLGSDLLQAAGRGNASHIRLEGHDTQGNTGLIAKSFRQGELFASGPQVVTIYRAESTSIACLHLVEPMIATLPGLLIARAGPLPTSDAVRKWFTKHGFSVGCYPLSDKQSSRVVADAMAGMNRKFTPQAHTWVLAHIGRDSASIHNQLHKLQLYSGSDSEISLADAQACLIPQRDVSMEVLAEQVFLSNTAAAIRALKGILEKPGVRAIAILRSLLATWLQLTNIQARLASGSTVQQAVDSIRPPIFFRMRDVLLRHAGHCSPADARRFIQHTLDSEIEIKSTRFSDRMILTHLITKLCARPKPEKRLPIPV